jgi:hypothetical protein
MLGIAAIAVAKPSLLLGAAALSIVCASALYMWVGRLQPFVLEQPST